MNAPVSTLPKTNPNTGTFITHKKPPYKLWAIATLMCNKFHRASENKSTLVEENGRYVWQPERIDCEPVPPLTHLPETGEGGHITTSRPPPYELKLIANLHCDPGYVSPKRNYARVVEDHNGQLHWNKERIDCVPVACPRPRDVPHATVTNGNYTFPNSFQYECARGYTLNGPATEYTCTAEGEWHPIITTDVSCNPDCPELQDPVSGSVTFAHRHFRAVATYECNPHSQIMRGQQRRVCEADGTWSGEEVVCDRVPCPEMDPTVKVVERTERFNRVECQDGSIAKVECRPNGQWAFPFPYCDPKFKKETGTGSRANLWLSLSALAMTVFVLLGLWMTRQRKTYERV